MASAERKAVPFTVEGGANSHVFEQQIMRGEECIAFADEPWASRIVRSLAAPAASTDSVGEAGLAAAVRGEIDRLQGADAAWAVGIRQRLTAALRALESTGAPSQ